MKRKVLIIVLISIIALPVCFILYAVADENAKNNNDLIINVETTSGSNDKTEVNNVKGSYNALPFEFEIKEAYSSHREVCADKDALNEYMHQYRIDSIQYARERNITADELEGYGYNESLYHLHLNKLREWELKFEPTETEKTEYKERFIEYYISINGTPGDESNRKTAEYYLNEYREGNISIDEAMEKSGAINHIELFADKKDTLHRILSESHLLGWYKTPDGVG